MLITNVVLFGPIGITIWAVQMLWIPLLAAGVINGIGHYWGYRNYETKDASTNIVPWGILVGGEELHNNHHAFPSAAKLSARAWELDIGWVYIRMLSALGLAQVKRMPPRAVLVPGKARADTDTVKAVLANRFQVMSEYGRQVLARVHAEELKGADEYTRGILRRARRFLLRDESRLTEDARQRIETALAQNQSLRTVYRYRQQLQQIWLERQASHERLVHSLQEWCRQAEATGIQALQDFARSLPKYSLPATA
jgi:stearoyl-CoA desaturase (delta-9 desaturase)